MAQSTTAPEILSANFGLDDALPVQANILCPGLLGNVAGGDGMPVVTSDLVDPGSLNPSDFEVITESGAVLVPRCATLNPANDDCEGRTILLVGELGSAETDPPVSVRIVDELLTLDGRDFRLTAGPIDVTPLEAGPTLVLVEQVDPASVSAPSGTSIVVRAVWGGGVTATDGAEVTPAEWEQYTLTFLDHDGQEQTVSPFDIGDLNDGDNNHLLFFASAGEPLTLALPAGLVTDPNGDLNPPTSSPVN